MNAVTNHRASQRFATNASVMFEDFRTGFNYRGTLYNYCTEGGYIESDYAPRPGRKVHVKVDGLPEIISPHLYLAEIRWRKPLTATQSTYNYGVGIKYCYSHPK